MPIEPVDGGASSTPNDFSIVRQQPAIITETDGTVKDAVTVTARESTYGIEFTFTMPTDQWQGAIFKTYAAEVASWIKALAEFDHVSDIYSAQDTNSRGLLNDYLWITVQTPDGNGEAVVKVLQANANTVGTFQKIQDTYATLLANQNAT